MVNLSKDEAVDVLTAWTVLEVLSPQTFLKPENLVSGDNSSVVMLNEKFLPWENGGEKAKPKTQIFYQVVVASINYQDAINMLMQKYNNINSIIENYSAAGEAIAGIAVVNQEGYIVSASCSSFAWGVNQFLQGNIKMLSKWSAIEEDITSKFMKIFNKQDSERNDLPINHSILDEAYYYLLSLLDIPEKLAIKKQFAIKTYEAKERKIPQTLLLNSFYLEDLEQAKLLIANSKNCATNLHQYLGIKTPNKRRDILHEDSVLENAIAPKNIPLGRWPGAGRHPLVLLQQAAVNLSQLELKNEGIFAINGPPGTGKTTLLRDIVASIVTKRAKALLTFDDPAEAFIATNCKISAGSGYLTLYQLDDRLKGFEVLISSSNNKAVENVSRELPSLNSIASDAHELRYFSNLADELLGIKSWGLISAVLGNSSNCNRFRQKFWWDKDCGLAVYLAEASGIPQSIDIKDPVTGKIIETRVPKIILENNPPSNYKEALKRWKNEKKNFINTLNNCQDRLNELENIRQDTLHLENLTQNLDLDNKTLEELILDHQAFKPSFIKHILRFRKALKWQNKLELLLTCYQLQKRIEAFTKKYGLSVINKEFFTKSHHDKNLLVPWCDPATNILRDEVFIAAIKLSKAFIDAAAKPLRHNLNILMKILGKPIKSNIDFGSKDEYLQFIKLLPNLWSSLFLVVPAVSTTFASIHKMFDSLPANSLGWLIIDEAGQASPQMAVGAIMKTKRAVITGDPLQIEPIVTLPPVLTKNICHEFAVDIKRFNPPQASVQTLADLAGNYYAEFATTNNGDRKVGFPLLVHRRCFEPMFSISNVIAYERLMVQAKKKGFSAIGQCLGASTWFHINGEAQDKWCKEEGEKVLQLLSNLKNHQIFPDLYIITPFKIVASNLRKLIKNSGVMDNWLNNHAYNWINEHVGTIHTVQGREADTVFLVLGAQAENQQPTRLWASSTPNILNVAVTRAKENIYVIGNNNLWREVGVFKQLHARIQHKQG